MQKKKTIKIGTRGSKLALWQANWVRDALIAHHADLNSDLNIDLNIELVIIKTKGDKILDTPLAQVGGKGLFVKEIETAMLDAEIDLAVHSMKDMPSFIPEGLQIGAIPPRENPHDVLISHPRNPCALSQLDNGARIGTCSLRRAAQLLHFRPDFKIMPLRGNLDTRLRKLESENLDAIILAAAGVLRLGLADRITEYIDEDIMLPAVGQGALCIETRADDPVIEPLIRHLNHPPTHIVVTGERAFLNHLEGGCQVPIAAHGHTDGQIFTLTGLVAATDGQTRIHDTASGPAQNSANIGVELAQRLLDRGARTILDEL